MKKRILILVSLVLVCATLFATDIESVLEQAKQNSSVYQGYVINHENTLINQRQKDLNGVSVTISGGVGYSESSAVVSPTRVSVSVPNIGDDIKLSVDASLSQINLKEKNAYTVSPSIKLTKDFEIKSVSDTRSEIEDLKSEIQTEVSYQTNLYNFENNVINSIVSIMNSKTKLDDAITSYEKAVKEYENDIRLGTIIEGYLPDIERKMKLSSLEATLNSTRASYEKSLKDFEHQYGIKYEEITSARDADLSFEPAEDGNSTVLISRMNYESAKQEYDLELGYSDKLNVTGTASTSITANSKVKVDPTFNLMASLSYTSDNWEIASSFSSKVGSNQKFDPTVTIQGRWTSDTTTSEKDKLTIQKMYNSLLEKENSYNNDLYSYKTNAETLVRDIETHKNDVALLEVQTQYHKTILEYQTALYEGGLSTKQNLEDAQKNYDKDLQQALILKLQALVLENKIKTIEL